MARTRHKTVQKIAPPVTGSTAKNSDLKQAAHKGAPPVKDPKSAPKGYTAVPVSTTALTPGEGPSQPANSPASRGGRKGKKGAKGAKGATPSVAGGSVQPIQKGGQNLKPKRKGRR